MPIIAIVFNILLESRENIYVKIEKGKIIAGIILYLTPKKLSKVTLYTIQ